MSGWARATELELGEGDGEGDELALVPSGFITMVVMVTGRTGEGGAVQDTVTLTRL